MKGRVADLEWWRAARYSAVSLVGIVVTQALLVGAHSLVGLDAVTSNVLACSLAAIPVFGLNRAWVWQLRGPSSLRSEIIPFWGFTLVGLGLSTVSVAVAAALTSSTLLLAAANIAAFGALWVAKFFVLDEVIFARIVTDELVVGTP